MIRLQVVDAHVTVSTFGLSMGARVAESLEGPARHSYHATGSFNRWGLQEMAADEESPGTFRCRGAVGETGEECFRIVVDADPGLRLFPEVPDSEPGSSIAFGPDKASSNNLWRVTSLKAGAVFEIVYDQTAADKRRKVDINWITDRFDFESLESTALSCVYGVPEGELL